MTVTIKRRTRFRRTPAIGLRAAFALLALSAAGGAFAQSTAVSNEERLDRLLKRFPAADANGDGVLTEAEARAFRKSDAEARSTRPTVAARRRRVPTRAGVSYGPHVRNTLDFWRAPSDQPTPVLVFFHGGSFKAGDKSNLLERQIFTQCLEAGISLVSANYRFSTDAPFPAPMHDGARAVQFVRSQAKEWNIDPARIAVSGVSAGATLALWIALHDDLADPASKDPVARLSTRVTCASPHSGTPGLEPAYFKQQAGIARLGPPIRQLFGASFQAELETAEKRALMREASPLVHATRDDPPLFLTYAGDPAEAPFPAGTSQSTWIHHVCLGLPLKARYEELGLECEFYYQSKSPAPGAEIAFLKKHLCP